MVLIAVCGAGKLFFDVASRTFTQRLLPDRLLTAVFGLQEATMMAGLAVGSVTASLLVNTAGPRASFVVAGLFMPTWRWSPGGLSGGWIPPRPCRWTASRSCAPSRCSPCSPRG